MLAALAVILGAFGAHGLEARVPPERLETFDEVGLLALIEGRIDLMRDALDAENEGWE